MQDVATRYSNLNIRKRLLSGGKFTFKLPQKNIHGLIISRGQYINTLRMLFNHREPVFLFHKTLLLRSLCNRV
jgi:hypothetical protein